MIGVLRKQLKPASGSTGRQFGLVQLWQWLTANGKKILTPGEGRRLRVCESVSLGDRRFAVLLEADGEHFLLGTSAAGVSLLTRLAGPSVQQQTAASTIASTPASAGTDSSDPGNALSSASQSVSPEDARAATFGNVLARATDATSKRSETQNPDRTLVISEPQHTPIPSSIPATTSGRRHAFPAGIAVALLLVSQLLLVPRSSPAQARPASSTTATAAKASPAMSPKVGTSATSTAPAANSGLSITGLGSSSAPWTIVVLLTVLTLIPSLMICMTPFARLLVVFHFLRQALGLQTTPSNQTLIGLSLILTFFIMQPLGKQIYDGSIVPLQNGQITALEAVDRGSEPLRHFMAHYVREKDAALFLEIAHAPQPRSIDDVSLRVLMPAYIVSELKAGFQIGAVLFLPFLVVDIVIASITTSVGMMQLPPVVISTPLKLMLFLMVDGWHLLIGSLVRSFY